MFRGIKQPDSAFVTKTEQADDQRALDKVCLWLDWHYFNENEVVLFFEWMKVHPENLPDTADIVRGGDLSPTMAPFSYVHNTSAIATLPRGQRT